MDIRTDPKAILERAKNGLKEKGWTRHTVMDHEGKMCLLGALNYGCMGSPLDGPYDVSLHEDVAKARPAYDKARELTLSCAHEKIDELMPGRGGMEGTGIMTFNDSIARGEQDVFAVLDCALAKAKAEA
jgi:hypothetical protein